MFERMFEFIFERMFEFILEFMFELIFEFILDIGVLVAIGVAMFEFIIRFMLLLLTELLVAAGPQAMPKAPNASIVESAIIFFITNYLPSSSKINAILIPSLHSRGAALFRSQSFLKQSTIYVSASK